jgi:tryptophan-rich sensory protein
MSLKLNYFIIPAAVILTAFLGSIFTGEGMVWYDTLKAPKIAPPGYVIGTVWTVLFALMAIAVLMFWNKTTANHNFNVIVILLIVNAVLNILWSALFFGMHSPLAAFIEIFFLNATTLALIILFWPQNLWSAILFIPYFLWVSFATYLNYLFLRLN